MKRPRSYLLLALLFSVALLIFTAVAPHRLEAVPRAEADFVPRMSPQEAQARVAAAQQAEAQRHEALARQLGATSAAALPRVQNIFFAQTGYHVSDRAGFLTFWRERGGVLIFGYPISEAIIEDGRLVQYFERARFEYHPEYLDRETQVQLSLLGRELTQGRDFPDGAPDGGTRYFPETRHTLSGKFLNYWLKRGGLEIFGYPISEPLEEVSLIDGQTRFTQYFERARFEYHPEQLDPFYQNQEHALGIQLAALHEVQLTDLGRQAAERHGHASTNSTRLAGVLDWAPTIWPRRIDIDISRQQLVAYEGDTPVYRAPIATGKDGFNTPAGSFAIYSKYPMETMAGSAGGETWYVPDIPWVQYVVGGVALHGTYWHDRWGTGYRLSHGCINLNIDDAQWLYEWADIGTSVDIHY